jgi:hypothetical protein
MIRGFTVNIETFRQTFDNGIILQRAFFEVYQETKAPNPNQKTT